MQLRRNPTTGQITDGNTPIILVGGHYFLFKRDGLSTYGINFGDPPQPTPIIWLPRTDNGPVEPCSTTTRQGSIQFWPSINGEGGYFPRMMKDKNNLVRVFLTNSFNTTDLFPYKIENGKLAVEDAIESGRWNEDYFDRLRSFVDQANMSGIAIQLSVFNFFDFDDRAWGPPNPPTTSGFSPWNAANTVDRTSNWSRDHLVRGDKPGARCAYFMDTANTGVSRVRSEFIKKLVNTLRGKGNVIFELMNEPRGEPGYLPSAKVKFLREVTASILAACGTSWRPLLSVNAFPGSLLNKITLDTPLDIDAWKAADVAQNDPNYDAIDIISYHGISGLSFEDDSCPRNSRPGAPAFAGVDRESIIDRRKRHFANFDKKAMIFSTDGAHQYRFKFTDGSEMRVRDGQVGTSLREEIDDRLTERHCSDLADWSYWCLKEATAYRGLCHFQNHSSFYRAILFIKESYDKVTGVGTGNDFVPPFAAPDWTTWRSASPPANDFFTAVRFDAALGGIVVQMGTVANPVDVSQAGAIEVGFLRVFTATSATVKVLANYSPTSVSIRSQGALVVPAVAMRLHAIDANGGVGGLIARVPAILAPNAPAGELQFTLAVTPGQRYGLILAADVGIQYQNRAQGYGEVIVSYPRVSLTM